MTRRMYDSVTVNDIPKDAPLVAGYKNGHYANVPAMHARFPHATVVTITPDGMHRANVDDRETGDDSAAGSAAWAKFELAAKRHPAIYCNLAALRDVLEAVNAQHLPHADVLIFTAHWTGKPHICDAACFKGYALPFEPNVIGTQYADPGTSGGHYDLSLVQDYWPGVDKVKPVPKPAAKTTPLNRVTRALIRKTTRLLERIVRRLSKRRRPTTPAGLGLLARLATLCTEFLAEYERIKKL